MADLDFQCCICEASFRPGTLDKAGKCPSCAEQFPTVKNKIEAMALNKPEIHLGKKLTEPDVRRIVREEMAAIKMERKQAAAEKARAIKESKNKQETK
jgi:hypothetical protein